MAMTIGNSNVTASPAVTAETKAVSQQAASTPAPAVVPKPTAAPQQPPPAQVQKAVEAMKQQIEAKAPNSLAFSVDSSNGRTIVKITDAKTGEMIRQIPSEEMVAIARSLDKLQGMLVQGKA